ncbi:hypothetical protein MKX01_033735 [Papaver californicum]|nr:hypothetical protein MKX01_033735 [Papaver californicum]
MIQLMLFVSVLFFATWRQVVIASGFTKSLCLRLFPETSSAIKPIEEDNIIEPLKVETTDSVEVEKLKKNHQVYALLARGLAPSLAKDCILEAISASSTDNYLIENIHNTLEPRDRVNGMGSYWLSMGESNPEVPETLTYKLVSKLCFITEINIQPLQDVNLPIWLAKAVSRPLWTYTSEKFPVVQENCLQKFKLPEPVLAIAGLLQIELLGRVVLAIDNLFYFCVTHVQLVGRPLRDDFVAELIDHSTKCILKYKPETATCNN